MTRGFKFGTTKVVMLNNHGFHYMLAAENESLLLHSSDVLALLSCAEFPGNISPGFVI
jgi:hypothetical protein